MVALMVMACSVSRDLDYCDVSLAGGSVKLVSTGAEIGRLQGVDWDRYGSRYLKSYRVELFDPKYRVYEAQLVKCLLNSESGVCEVHVTYSK